MRKLCCCCLLMTRQDECEHFVISPSIHPIASILKCFCYYTGFVRNYNSAAPFKMTRIKKSRRSMLYCLQKISNWMDNSTWHWIWNHTKKTNQSEFGEVNGNYCISFHLWDAKLSSQCDKIVKGYGFLRLTWWSRKKDYSFYYAVSFLFSSGNL